MRFNRQNSNTRPSQNNSGFAQDTLIYDDDDDGIVIEGLDTPSNYSNYANSSNSSNYSNYDQYPNNSNYSNQSNHSNHSNQQLNTNYNAVTSFDLSDEDDTYYLHDDDYYPNQPAQNYLNDSNNYNRQTQPVKKQHTRKEREPKKAESKYKNTSLPFIKLPKPILIGIPVLLIVIVAASLGNRVLTKNESTGATLVAEETYGEASSMANTVQEIFPLSEEELLLTLEDLGYSDEDIENVDTSTLDWNAVALQRAEAYLDMTGFSKSGLYDKLVSMGFSEENAQYAIDNLPETDWGEEAYQRGALYLNSYVITAKDMKDILVLDGFSEEDAEYAANKLPCDDEE